MLTDLRFVFDTSAIVSAVLLKQSVVRQAFDKAVKQGKLLVSQATVDEINEVLRRKGFDKYILEEERIEFITALVRKAILLEATFDLPAVAWGDSVHGLDDQRNVPQELLFSFRKVIANALSNQQGNTTARFGRTLRRGRFQR
ncbi:MAG: PIN domain-containing protein [Chloroflexi bacterium]|nr:PIN domain-containing protein [Chloroflexota bacterium]